ncbi:hypothetical protein BH10BAC2_BH10BAC2_11060 [soil metagenome]
MAKIKGGAAAKPGKKEMRQQIEDLLMKKAAEMLGGSDVPKHLHKKIKKAGKLVIDEILESIKSQRIPAPVKKSIPAKAIVKKATAKKATTKKAKASLK